MKNKNLPKYSNWITVTLIVTLGILVLIAPANGDDNLMPSTGMAEFLTLKEDPTVQGDYVTLSDLFDGAGERGDTRLIKAPKPGARLAISSAALADFLRKKNLYWANTARVTRVFVTRESEVIKEADVVSAIEAALLDQGEEEAFDIVLHNRNLEIHLPVGMSTDFTVASLDLNNNTFTAELSVPAGEEDRSLTTISGSLVPVTLIPVLTRPVSRGEKLVRDDFRIDRMPSQRIGANVIDSLDAISGMEARRALRVGQPVRTTDLQAPNLIEKGALVTMTFKAPGIQLTNVGRAMESGALGDVINVMNIKSRKTIMAEIVSTNQVSVNLGGQTQLASLR